MKLVNNKLVLTEYAIKKINRYASSSIKYYLRFVESFYVYVYILVLLLVDIYILFINDRSKKKCSIDFLGKESCQIKCPTHLWNQCY